MVADRGAGQIALFGTDTGLDQLCGAIYAIVDTVQEGARRERGRTLGCGVGTIANGFAISTHLFYFSSFP